MRRKALARELMRVSGLEALSFTYTDNIAQDVITSAAHMHHAISTEVME